MVQEVANEKEAIFQGLEADFSSFPSISREMVEQAYCSCRRAGFRFQVSMLLSSGILSAQLPTASCMANRCSAAGLVAYKRCGSQAVYIQLKCRPTIRLDVPLHDSCFRVSVD